MAVAPPSVRKEKVLSGITTGTREEQGKPEAKRLYCKSKPSKYQTHHICCQNLANISSNTFSAIAPSIIPKPTMLILSASYDHFSGNTKYSRVVKCATSRISARYRNAFIWNYLNSGCIVKLYLIAVHRISPVKEERHRQPLRIDRPVRHLLHCHRFQPAHHLLPANPQTL